MHKIKAITSVLQQLINENTQLRDLAVGTLETIKQMPDYDEAIEKLKKEVTKKDSNTLDDFSEFDNFLDDDDSDEPQFENIDDFDDL